ncbi:hypothetical protein CEXT_100291 [Caerostris extrusa]|uniref:Uncharacterized protein n=1 Tax=Caerostris extrusa TaxID=172846 RepID=A0AAV4P7D4_CAEEX|nr:hypothetical protein CEXT_100291 [Caerostris extrusa]
MEAGRVCRMYISWESMLSPMYRRRKQQRTLAAEEFGRSFQSNRLMMEAGRVCRMCIFPWNQCYPQCTDAGKQQRTLAAEEFGRSFQSNRRMVEAGRVCRMCIFPGNRCYPQCTDAESSRGRWQQKSSADHFKAIDGWWKQAEYVECVYFLGINVIPNVQKQEAAENVGSRRVRQIISKQSTDDGSRQSMSNVYITWESMLSPMYRRRKQQRTLAAEEFGRSFQSNRRMVEAGRVCRMCIFPGNQCYPQCTEAGSSRERWQQKSSADHFKAIDW